MDTVTSASEPSRPDGSIQVTKHNFAEYLPEIKKDIDRSVFIGEPGMNILCIQGVFFDINKREMSMSLLCGNSINE